MALGGRRLPIAALPASCRPPCLGAPAMPKAVAQAMQPGNVAKTFWPLMACLG